jgi:hypothetical protein
MIVNTRINRESRDLARWAVTAPDGAAVRSPQRNSINVIDIKSLAPALRKGLRPTGTIPFNEGQFPVVVTVDRVRLVWTTPTYGGRRWWFICPRTARRTAKLFLPNGGWHFWNRQAYRLGYACQREGRFDRLQRRAAMLNRQLGGDGWGSWDTPHQNRNGCDGVHMNKNTRSGDEWSRKPTESSPCAPRACHRCHRR